MFFNEERVVKTRQIKGLIMKFNKIGFMAVLLSIASFNAVLGALSLDYGHYNTIGDRPTMEDAHFSARCLDDFGQYAFFGVYDGHGGKDIAGYVACRLHKNILASMNGQGVEKAIKEGVKKTEEAVLKLGGDYMEQGTTAVFAVIDTVNQKLYVANVGDSRAVLGRVNGRAKALSIDHKPSLESEAKRIGEEQGHIFEEEGIIRVMPKKDATKSLSVSRARYEFEYVGTGQLHLSHIALPCPRR